MDRQCSSQFGYSQHLLSNFVTPRHICSLCGKNRSKRYHDEHPLVSGQAPEPGICSRPRCAKAVNDMLRRLYPAIIYETHHHHHYHSGLGLEGPPPSYTDTEVRLTDNEFRRDPSPILEEPFYSTNITSGREEASPNITPAELSGVSSLTGRVELPDNRCLRRRAFKRVFPCSEESPPPVNFLSKPKPQQ